jgi:hypothetical protein
MSGPKKAWFDWSKREKGATTKVIIAYWRGAVGHIGEPPEKVEFEGKRARPKIFPRPPDSTI